MTKEIYHEGWLIKSPPTKRILRARWRRRWFTLKQGEIPEQFCLEYYKDRNCRKLKGVIDLDQCEQVDSGLQLEHRKQKFAYMFDVKTPQRTYYLAANSEEDMNAWVNCICEVCNLQDLTKPQQQNNDNGQYHNLTSETAENQAAAANASLVSTLKTTTLSPVKSANASDQIALLPTAEPIDNNNSVYQNYDAMCRNSSYNNRETLICDAPLNKSGAKETKEDYYNFVAIANTASRAQKSDDVGVSRLNRNNNGPPLGERKMVVNQAIHRKIPENLKLNSAVSELPSHTTSASTGPYIAISDCISGNPLTDRDNPTTPLNSLDPKFYDTPRSHFNIGLNLTNDQPYSPKRNNILTVPPQTPQSGKSTPTDSESVFTDDEEWMPTPTGSTNGGNGTRCPRPSESSVENESIVFTYAQRFSKMPEFESAPAKKVNPKKPVPVVVGLSIEKTDTEEQNKDINSSDTENASPAITYGPKDMNSYVDENYDIPRSHQLPYTRMSELKDDENAIGLGASGTSASMLELDDNSSSKIKSPSPNAKSSTMPKKTKHFYTNAAPTRYEGHYFRYDFDEKQSDAPAVDRKLKPKMHHDDNEKLTTPNKVKPVPLVKPSPPNQLSVDLKPPCIDRKLKPTTPIKLETSTLQRRGVLTTATDAEFQGTYNNDQISKTLPRNYNNSASLIANSTPAPTVPATAAVVAATAATVAAAAATPGRQPGVLEYFDLDHSNPPPICNNSNTSVSTSNLNAQPTAPGWQPNLSHRLSAVSISSSSVFGAQNATNDAAIGSSPLSSTSTSGVAPPASGVVYKSVDFVKTEAFMRTRQDAEMARAKNRSKE